MGPGGRITPRRLTAVAIGITAGLCACGGNSPNLNKPDPNAYLLRFQPESVAQIVGTSGTIAMFAKRSSGEDVPIRIVEWSVADGLIASLSDSAVSTDGTIYATVKITCEKAGLTSVTGAATIGFEQRLSDKVSVPCTAPSSDR